MKDIELLRDWFVESKREFPWREVPSPYAVWVSEVMLQQTQAATVVPYFLRWMERFPDVATLARASVEEVMKMWEGLGYYARARRLHAGAQQVVRDFEGQIPGEEEALQKICGIGPYTCGAILSFAFHKKAPAVDGNVGRVLARYLGIKEPLSRPAVQKALRIETMALLPEEHPWEVMEGLIELGATLCRPKSPSCLYCPLQEGCWALAHHQVESLPAKEKSIAITPLLRAVFVLVKDGHLALQQGPVGSIMEGLYEFPYVDVPEKEEAIDHNFWLPSGWSLERGKRWELLPSVTHTFTRFKATLFPAMTQVNAYELLPEPYQWIPFSRIGDLSFSSGHRKILQHPSIQEMLLGAS